MSRPAHRLEAGQIAAGDSREWMERIDDGSVDLSFWSPPYFVGKSYEAHLDFDGWQSLIADVIAAAHSRVMKPGGFMVVNI